MFTISFTKHVMLMSVTHLQLDFYVSLLSWKTVYSAVSLRGWRVSPISCCQNMRKQNAIIFVVLVPFHSIQLPAVHGHLPLTPTLSHFHSSFEDTCDCTEQCCIWETITQQKFPAEIWAGTGAALCRFGAFRGGQHRHAAPDKFYCVYDRLQDHGNRNAGCEA